MTSLPVMSPMIYEDRTTETPEQAHERELLGAGAVLATHAAALCQGNPQIMVRALAVTLGLVSAQLGLSLEETEELLREKRRVAESALREQARLGLPTTPISQA